MAELWEYTKLIRSKNAGPFELTFDIMFKERSGYDLALKSGKLSPRSRMRYAFLRLSRS
jgi:hypothetical protein